jgi:hypothetical protein
MKLNYDITVYKPNGSLTREAHALMRELKREMNVWENRNVKVFFGELVPEHDSYTLLQHPELTELKIVIYDK